MYKNSFGSSKEADSPINTCHDRGDTTSARVTTQPAARAAQRGCGTDPSLPRCPSSRGASGCRAPPKASPARRRYQPGPQRYIRHGRHRSAPSAALPHQRSGAPRDNGGPGTGPGGPAGVTAARTGPLPPPHPLPAAAAQPGSTGRSRRRVTGGARGTAIPSDTGSAMVDDPAGSGGGRRGLTMVADGGGCCGAGGSRQWRRLGPVSLASAERAEESADVSRRLLIGRRRRGAGLALSACAAAPLYPARSMVGRMFRLAGTTWGSPGLHRDCSEATPGEQRPAAAAPPRPGCNGGTVRPSRCRCRNRLGAVRPPSERYHRAAGERGGSAARRRR